MNYKIEAINILLNEDCIINRYYPLIKYKDSLLCLFKKYNVKTRNDCLNVRVDLVDLFKDPRLVNLFCRFLIMYDSDDKKLKGLTRLSVSDDEMKSYKELFLLPGVKETRAKLYYLAGYKTLKDIADSSVKDILDKMADTIKENKLECVLPFEKELRTHIAVAKTFTYYKAE